MNWTARDEAAFKASQDEQRAKAARRQAAIDHLAQLLRDIETDCEGYMDDAAVDSVIQMADQLRDALAPFDSGIRCAVLTGDRPPNE